MFERNSIVEKKRKKKKKKKKESVRESLNKFRNDDGTAQQRNQPASTIGNILLERDVVMGLIHNCSI